MGNGRLSVLYTIEHKRANEAYEFVTTVPADNQKAYKSAAERLPAASVA